MTECAIVAEGLGKKYRLGEFIRYKTLRDVLGRAAAAPFRMLRGESLPKLQREEFWALRDLSFSVNTGECLGVIGHNGAGKSTLLKLLTRITQPSEGFATLRGHVGSLLEVGTGFNPELTGRENVFINGAVLGMSRREVLQKFDEIVDFAGVETFIDTPVKRYSSGMQMRLAFAVAAHLEPEIMLIDEVLAVGDAAFRKKSLGKMREVASAGRTIVFVSHNLAAVQNLCDRVMLLEHGRVRAIGKPDEIIADYVSSAETQSSTALSGRVDRKGSGIARITEVSFYNSFGEPTNSLISGEAAEIRLRYAAGTELKNVRASIVIDTLFGQRTCHMSTEWTDQDFAVLPSQGQLCCRLPQVMLNTGHYSLTIDLTVNGDSADWMMGAVPLFVEQGNAYGTGRAPGPQDGLLLHDQSWSLMARQAETP